MDQSRKKHNWKARRATVTKIDRSEEANIQIDLEGHRDDDYNVDHVDNVLVLPSKKRKTNTVLVGAPQKRLLSKKQRKHLQRIMDIKEKKLRRADLLEDLKLNQITREELDLFTSTSQMQTRIDNQKVVTSKFINDKDLENINVIKCSKHKRRNKILKPLIVEEKEVESESSGFSSSEVDEPMEEDDEEEIEVDEEVDTAMDQSDVVIVKHKDVKLDSKKSAKNKTPKVKIPAIYVQLERDIKMQEQRLLLPILAEEQTIMETITSNPVTVLCGATGSGKTTQVPQFLYEAGYARDGKMIGVTEPRRVAAISMSKRVALEMNLSKDIVSYQIRYEGNTTPNTLLKFQTDGVLLKEIQQDFLLEKYSAIIIDEAHERSVFTDILIGLLSRIVHLRNKRRNPLKLVIMSATLRIEDFTMNKSLFKIAPPVIEVEARQHPVTIHFSRRTPDDYLKEAFNKVVKIHSELPEGGILVFVTGQLEVNQLCSKLRSSFPEHSSNKDEGNFKKFKRIDLDTFSTVPDDEQADIIDDDEVYTDLGESGTVINCKDPIYILPLYSLLTSEKQARVFETPPPDCRLIIVATNVAETSLTIPNIKYVVDTGKVKTKFYDKVTGVSTFKITNTSQASANQRAGRAGRTGPGHCYRLFSSAVFNDEFLEFSLPEILRRPVDDLMLQMKDMGIDKVVNFPFPTNPGLLSLQVAEKLLQSLGALQPSRLGIKNKQEALRERGSSRITELGRKMCTFPVAPRFARMLTMAASLGNTKIVEYVIIIVSALSVQELFVDDQLLAETEDEEKKQRKMKFKQQLAIWAGQGESWLLGDAMVLLKAVGAAEYTNCSPAFCLKFCIRSKAMAEIRKLRVQLTNAVNSIINGSKVCVDPQMSPPTQEDARKLREIVLSGFSDQIARKVIVTGSENDKSNKNLKYAYKTISMEDHVYIHPNSALHKKNVEYVCYQRIDETSKLYMKGVVVVEAKWLPLYAGGSCSFNKPESEPEPRFDARTGTIRCHVTGTFGPHFWNLPLIEMEYPTGLDKYKWFARLFLEGVVTHSDVIAKLADNYLLSPVTMIKPWANLQSKTETLLKALISEEVHTRDQLYKVWTKTPEYLQTELLEWLPESLHEACKKKWRNIIEIRK